MSSDKNRDDFIAKIRNHIKKKKKKKNLKSNLHRIKLKKHKSTTESGSKHHSIPQHQSQSQINSPIVQRNHSDDESTESTASMKNSALETDKCEKCCSLREIVGLDCEFVGCGMKGRINALGRATIVDYHGNKIYDQVALPEREITDFRTPWSGLRPRDFIKAIPEEFVKLKVREVLKGRIVVGHMLKNDFKVLQYSHDRHLVRDTALYAPIRQLCGAHPHDKRPMALRKLTKFLLNRDIQTSEHDSFEDAKASLDLYKLVESSWELELHANASTNSEIQTDSVHSSDKPENMSWFDDQFWPDDDE